MIRLVFVLITALTVFALGACASGPRIDTRHASPAHDSRVRYIIVHYTAVDFEESLRLLTTTGVSSHYLIDRDPARIHRLVPEHRRARHAGVSSWRGETYLNTASIGIEIVNRGYDWGAPDEWEPYDEAQIAAAAWLIGDIARRHDIAPHRILGHAEVSPGRKSDPGPLFPWRRLAWAGLVPWPDETRLEELSAQYQDALPDAGWHQARLRRHGLGVEVTSVWDDQTRHALQAFQMRFRPARHDGVSDAQTAALLDLVTSPEGLMIRGADGVWRPYDARTG
ncbi:N-acetylmuramoyl-L-alanine amidase [Alkalicaulis satelles]|uniref:N-acetylmuramoyl-L-alanine amidase n=1 Tax=Alkalicaulis satelles TaxID=2609175 RepID=A0A5M6ZF76_9PROT|nr:N-acetylmuramoyl-L-alanine amidase [Alkalicaulis satelles]KAA5803393.1 N-acetylmuramoyl-L-alanine amidase [Alkalicaulis satelles]